jgi:hypothetical protein
MVVGVKGVVVNQIDLMVQPPLLCFDSVTQLAVNKDWFGTYLLSIDTHRVIFIKRRRELHQSKCVLLMKDEMEVS